MKSPKYSDLRNELERSNVGQDHASQEDEFEQSEKGWQREAKKSKCAGFWAIITSFRSILDSILLIVILYLLVDRRGRQEPKTAEFEFAGDLTGFAPRFSQQIKTFVPDHGFIPENSSEFFSEEVQNRWKGIVPRGLGYVLVNDTSPYNNLPRKLETYPDSTFTTSVTHQLHCLHAIIGTFAMLTSKEPGNAPEEGAWHVAHCFEYLRQTIMCCGDVALEGQATTFPPGWVGSDGWDAKHVCKDYSEILDYLDENRVNDDRWI
ncbi:protein of unknown function (DUF3328) domain containing protein [Naviculisporaceae sp. PSN 640]